MPRFGFLLHVCYRMRMFSGAICNVSKGGFDLVCMPEVVSFVDAVWRSEVLTASVWRPVEPGFIFLWICSCYAIVLDIWW